MMVGVIFLKAQACDSVNNKLEMTGGEVKSPVWSYHSSLVKSCDQQ
jgi:hypothetical protein